MKYSSHDQLNFLVSLRCSEHFTLVKPLMKCIGKSLYGSGVENIHLGAGGYGPNTIERSILNRKHYNRAFDALSVLAEALHHLILKEFFATNGIQKYSEEINNLLDMKKVCSIKRHQRESIMLLGI